MEIIFKLIRVGLLVLSCLGWIDYLTSEKKIKVEFSIFILLNGIGSAMFLAGILNILKLAVFLIWSIGGVLFIRIAIKRRRINNYFTVGTVALFAFFCGAFVLLYGTKLINYDNFSHWAVVAKELLLNNRFPNFQDSHIMFQSYPPGSAAYIYYICKITGIYSEWMMMYAQATMILGNLAVLYVFVRKRFWNIFLATITIVFVLCSNVRLTDIYVDTLLMSVAAGGLLFCMYYKNEMQKRYVYLIGALVNLVGIKNSGIFFVLIISVYIVTFSLNIKEDWKKLLIIIGAPISSLILWQSHVKIVFESGMSTKHSMSAENLQNIWSEKTSETVIEIMRAFCEQVFSWRNGIFYLLFGILLIHFILKTIKQKSFMKQKDVLFIVGTYIAYMVSLFAMYLFSMPTEEAVRVAAFERYHRTIIDFLVMMNAPYIFKIKMKKCCLATLILSIVIEYFTISPHMEYLTRVNWKESKRYEYEMVIEKNKIPNDSSYIFLQKDEDAGYSYYFFRYYFQTTKVAVFNETQLNNQFEDIIVQWENYDYLIILDRTRGSDRFVKDISGKELYTQVINLQQYKTK